MYEVRNFEGHVAFDLKYFACMRWTAWREVENDFSFDIWT